jgi:ankyrin repeat protein
MKIKLVMLFALLFGFTVNVFAAGKKIIDGVQPMGPASKASELFYSAAKNKNLEMMDTYLARGADVDCGNCDYSAKTPLAMALTTPWGSPDVVEYLIKHGANVNLLTQGKMSPLMFALMDNSGTDMKRNVTFLVDSGANVKMVSVSGNNALTMLSMKGYTQYSYLEVLQMMQYLVKKGVDVDHQNADKKTALMLSAKGCGVSSVQLLLSLHADYSLKDQNGETALNIAEDSAASSGSGSSCNQVVAMLRSPEKYMTSPLSNSDVVGDVPGRGNAGASNGVPGQPNPVADLQGLFSGIGKLLGK